MPDPTPDLDTDKIDNLVAARTFSSLTGDCLVAQMDTIKSIFMGVFDEKQLKMNLLRFKIEFYVPLRKYPQETVLTAQKYLTKTVKALLGDTWETTIVDDRDTIVPNGPRKKPKKSNRGRAKSIPKVPRRKRTASRSKRISP